MINYVNFCIVFALNFLIFHFILLRGNKKVAKQIIFLPHPTHLKIFFG